VRRGAFITMFWMEMVIHVAPEVGSSVKPWAGADKDAVIEPLRAIVAGGRASIGSGVIVSVGAVGCYTDVYADLGLCFRGDRRGADSGHGTQQYECKSAH
jgi:hypothetical protein